MKDHLHCLCGLLVAKQKENGIELKCRRCKRFVLIPFMVTGQEQLVYMSEGGSPPR